MFDFRVDVIGNLDPLTQALSTGGIVAGMGRVRDLVLKRLADKYVARVQELIDSGGAGGPALSEFTIINKGHGTKWRDSGDLRDALVARKKSDGWFGGIPVEAVNSNGQSLQLIALILEVGSITIPARPLFGKVRDELGSLSPNEIASQREITGAFIG